MKTYTWNEFYEKFYDGSFDTQKKKVKQLTDFGDEDEIVEVFNEFAYYDEKFANEFIRSVMKTNVVFTPEQILNMAISLDETNLNEMVVSAKGLFNREQLENIYAFIDDDLFEQISKKANIQLFEDDEDTMIELEETQEVVQEKYIPPRKKKTGFFTSLLGVMGIMALFGHQKKKQFGRCNGDCANCPPHYGYRYGRWYYGKGHIGGCEFGGNKGDGSW